MYFPTIRNNALELEHEVREMFHGCPIDATRIIRRPSPSHRLLRSFGVKVLLSLFSFLLLQVVSGLIAVSGVAQAPTSAAGSIGVTPKWERPALTFATSPAEARPSRSADLVEAPEPEFSMDGGEQRGHVPWAATEHQQPYSRIGIGADVSPLGIGIKSAIVLTQYFDGRAMVNFFNFDSGNFELEGFRTDARLHLLSAGAALDLYPMNSFWRVSAGLLIANGNQLSAKTRITPGTSFSLNGQTFYSSTADPANGSGVLAMHRHTPSFLASFGFGKFIPRSNRHWSFPSEFGVVFTGAPTINVTTGGTVCQDAALTLCSSVNNSSTPVGAAFNSSLQTQLAKWRQSLSSVTIYPIFSYSAMYSFNVRH